MAYDALAYDAIVIGGGLIGMLTARNLQIAGFDVALIEKSKLGGESSWAAGGILSKLHPWQQSDAVQKLIAQGQSAFPALVAELKDETGIDSQLLHSGMLIVDVDEQQAALNWSDKNNTKIESVDQDAIDRLEPNLNKNINLALHIPSVMQVRVPLLIEAVRKSLRKHGVRIYEGVEVNGLAQKSGKAVGVETKQKKMFAEHIIMCSGAWTQQLLKNTGGFATDIEPVRGQMLLFKIKQNLLSHIIVKNEHYLIPRKDRYLLCGSTLEYVGFDKATTSQAKDFLHSQAYTLCPQLKDEEIIQHWSGLRPGTTREVPYICAHPELEGLYINAGHFRYGIVMSIPSAKIATDLVANRVSRSQKSAYTW